MRRGRSEDAVSALLVGLGVGFLMGASKNRIKALLGYYFPKISLVGFCHKGDDVSSRELLQVANGIIRRTVREYSGGCCILSSIDSSTGAPRARPVNPMRYSLDDEPEPYVVFFTNRKSRKTRDMEKDPRVELTYFDPKGMGYVSLSGRVQEMPRGQARKEWQERMRFVMEEGPDGDRFTTYRLSPTRLEVVHLWKGFNNGLQEDWAPWKLSYVGGEWIDEKNCKSLHVATF